jgi:hypothetical protein
MALAIKLQGAVSRGELQDHADIARLGHVTHARATQIVNLVNLALDIQEQLLFIEPTTATGRYLRARSRWNCGAGMLARTAWALASALAGCGWAPATLAGLNTARRVL